MSFAQKVRENSPEILSKSEAQWRCDDVINKIASAYEYEVKSRDRIAACPNLRCGVSVTIDKHNNAVFVNPNFDSTNYYKPNDVPNADIKKVKSLFSKHVQTYVSSGSYSGGSMYIGVRIVIPENWESNETFDKDLITACNEHFRRLKR